MSEFYYLAEKFLETRRSFPYVKFDREITKKINNDICILSYLYAHGKEAYPKDLSREFMVSSARMAVLLNALEEKNYISRSMDKRDNRRTVIKLLPRGEEFFVKENEKILKFIETFFKDLGKEDAGEFVRLYAKLMKFVAKA